MNTLLTIIVSLSIIVFVGEYFFVAKRQYANMRYANLCEVGLIFAGIFLLLRLYTFEAVLTLVVLISFFICVFDWLFLRKARKQRIKEAELAVGGKLSKEKKEEVMCLPTLIDYGRSFFPVLLLVLVLRSFWFEPFRIPSGSLEPTLLVGDFILVNKYAYGLHVPVTNTDIFPMGRPKRGDIVVFHWPVNKKYDLIKRVIGLPGDTISYIDKVLYINGKKAPQILQKEVEYQLENHTHVMASQKQEDLLGVKHEIYTMAARPSSNFENITVPKGMYFMMGDNRDDSEDSRYWGFVPEENLVGKASYILLSLSQDSFGLRPHRYWKKID
ncbi:MAG: signal peptidase I [Gammaproteobacteria bacterium]